jgi:hypothetical protein
MSAITGPIPPYSNPPIQPQFFQPSVFFISAISLGQTTTVTTTENVNYVVGQLCRLIVPNGFGSSAISQQTGYVIAIPSPNQVTLNINSTGITPFTNPGFPTQAQIVAVGDVNSGTTNLGRQNNSTLIPGSFINISPL